MSYQGLKLLHILSATILFGTGLGSAFYMFAANRRGELGGIVFAIRHVVIADFAFTTPAIVVQFVTGILLLDRAGHSFGDPWVIAALVLFVFVGACWLPVVWLQIKMRDMAKTAIETKTGLPERYWRYDRWWIALGSLAFPSVLLIFYLMVFRPDWG